MANSRDENKHASKEAEAQPDQVSGTGINVPGEDELGDRHKGGELKSSDRREPAKKEPPEPGKQDRKTSGLKNNPIVTISFDFPNGSVGKTFEHTIKPTFLIDHAGDTDLTKLPIDFGTLPQEYGIFLEVNAKSINVTGTPIKAGEHSISLGYEIVDAVGGSQAQIVKINWVVNPDPRTLWKNIEPDFSLQFPKANSYRERVHVAPIVMVGASARGRSHAHEGSFREDDFRIFHDDKTGWNLMVVSDGAGSAKLSRRGSELACETVRNEFTVLFEGELSNPRFQEHVREFKSTQGDAEKSNIRRILYDSMGGVALKAKQALAKATSEAGVDHKEMAATLIVTIAKNFDFGWFVAAFCIGDGGTAIYSQGKSVQVLNDPDGGDFAGQTRFLNTPEVWATGGSILERVQFAVVKDFTAIVSMTDGISDPCFQTENQFRDLKYWDQFWSELGRSVCLDPPNNVSDSELLEWLDFWSVGNHDDRTICILTKTNNGDEEECGEETRPLVADNEPSANVQIPLKGIMGWIPDFLKPKSKPNK